MSNYKHGIRTSRQATAISIPVTSDGCIQCVVGTAPVNLAADPYDTVNKPFACLKKEDAVTALGYCNDFKNYTLCQSIYATFNIFAVAPLILINVLNPKKHVKASVSKTYTVEGGNIVIDEEGILLDQLNIANEGGTTTYKADLVYVASFSSDGTVTVSIVKTGAAKSEKSLKASFVQLDPSAVTYEDVIGSIDAVTKKKTGLELVNMF